MIIIMRDGDLEAERRALIVIEESGDWYSLKKGWKARADKPHTTGMMNHSHLYFNKHEIGVINSDGSASHGSDLSKIPNHVFKSLKAKGLLEGANTLLEAASFSLSVPKEVMSDLYEAIERKARFENIMRGIGYTRP